MTQPQRRLLSPLLAVFALFAVGLGAQDATALARAADKQLRTAERSMFAGKIEQAQQEFGEAEKLIGELKGLDPKHSRLRSLENKQSKLRRDLERRLGKKPPAKGAGEPAKKPAKSDKLPGGVSKRLREIDQGIAKLRQYIARESPASPKDRAGNAARLLAAAREPLAQIDKLYGDQVPAKHPDLVACRERLAAAGREAEAFSSQLLAAVEAAAPTGPSAEQIAADAQEVAALAEEFLEPLSLIHGNSLVYGLKLADAQKALAQLETVEQQQALPTLQPLIARLAKTYGTSAMKVNNKIHGLGAPREHQFGNKFERLVEGAQNVRKSRVASAASVAKNATMMLSSIDKVAPDIRVKRMQEWQQILQVGQQLDPNNAEINAWLADIDARISEVAGKIEKDIDSKTWAGHVKGFAGPGDVDSLSAAALAWFRKDRGWGGNTKKEVEIVAVAVRGPWQVAERDVFSRVVRWRLPIHTAVTDEALRAKNIARVYELSIVAMAGSPDAASKAPPFDGCWVGRNWMMHLDKLAK